MCEIAPCQFRTWYMCCSVGYCIFWLVGILLIVAFPSTSPLQSNPISPFSISQSIDENVENKLAEIERAIAAASEWEKRIVPFSAKGACSGRAWRRRGGKKCRLGKSTSRISRMSTAFSSPGTCGPTRASTPSGSSSRSPLSSRPSRRVFVK